jgi:hypothetical protein
MATTSTKTSVQTGLKNTPQSAPAVRYRVWIFLFVLIFQIGLVIKNPVEVRAEDAFYLDDPEHSEQVSPLSKPIKEHKKFLSKLDLSGAKDEEEFRKRLGKAVEAVGEISKNYQNIASSRGSHIPGFFADILTGNLHWALQAHLAQVKLPADLAPAVRDALQREVSALVSRSLEQASLYYNNALLSASARGLEGHPAAGLARTRLFEIQTMAPDEGVP